MAIHLDRQRPPKKKMGRKQRKGSKSNPATGVQWANWLDDPAGAPGGGGGGGDPFTFTSITPSTGVVGAAVTATVIGTGFDPAATVAIGAEAVTTTFVSSTELTVAFSILVASAGSLVCYVGNPGGVWTDPFTFTATAASADPTSSWTKAEIAGWLRDKGVDLAPGAEGHFTKAELLDIVAAYLNGDPVDDLLGA